MMKIRYAILFSVLMLILTADALADAPGVVNYQGYLTDAGGVPLDDTVAMTFKIYSTAAGGSAPAGS